MSDKESLTPALTSLERVAEGHVEVHARCAVPALVAELVLALVDASAGAGAHALDGVGVALAHGHLLLHQPGQVLADAHC